MLMKRKPKKKMGSLVFQLNNFFERISRFGTSKYVAQKNGVDTTLYFYSYKTRKIYTDVCARFLKDMKKTYPHIRLLEEVTIFHGREWLQQRIEQGYSASTIQTERSALAKLFSCNGPEILSDPPKRSRATITNNRGISPMAGEIDLSKHQEFISFIKATGLRREEAEQLKGGSVSLIDDKPKIVVVNGKGGRKRYAPILGSPKEVQAVVDVVNSISPDALVWGKQPSRLPTHRIRSEYANKLYLEHRRPLGDITNRKEIYFFRNELVGYRADKRALEIVSQALGHNRRSVVALHYLSKEVLEYKE